MILVVYITLNTTETAKAVSMELLKKQLCVCTNWFPINCAYRWEGEIKFDEPEVVLLVKTKPGNFTAITKVVQNHIDYTNCMAELQTGETFPPFLDWMGKEVK